MKELCWLITTDCNQNCGYCSRFLKKTNLTEKEYFKVVDKLIQYKVRQVTFGGGEPLLVPEFEDIVYLLKQANIHLKLVTNGSKLILHKKIIPFLDEITISIDSVDATINKKLGRGEAHYKTVCDALGFIKGNKYITKININSVASKYNIHYLIQMIPFLVKYDIFQWRIFRFAPLREKAMKNRFQFEISENDFNKLKNTIISHNLPCAVQFRNYDDMSSKYLLIAPDGDLYLSNNLRDVRVGNILTTGELDIYF